jgi:hypothetical protein
MRGIARARRSSRRRNRRAARAREADRLDRRMRDEGLTDRITHADHER